MQFPGHKALRIYDAAIFEVVAALNALTVFVFLAAIILDLLKISGPVWVSGMLFFALALPPRLAISLRRFAVSTLPA